MNVSVILACLSPRPCLQASGTARRTLINSPEKKKGNLSLWQTRALFALEPGNQVMAGSDVSRQQGNSSTWLKVAAAAAAAATATTTTTTTMTTTTTTYPSPPSTYPSPPSTYPSPPSTYNVHKHTDVGQKSMFVDISGFRSLFAEKYCGHVDSVGISETG
ncbi:hypothetical protein PoB_001924500 [Plakobranchus ocellatus]|uniref:Uncharacterized protein n=1 Tax=Plakobranchus ocellatus TaxID=259542 RepID=A0AAV3ZDU9_9GAST|nr:hypothetical protein PoB_001924500 [Plakobranchus ocellatus]